MHFLEHLSLGQYVPAKSFIHSLDPRSKVLAVMFLITSVFLANTTLWPYVIWFVLIVIISSLSNISFKTVVTSTRPVLILIVFTLAINLFFADGRELFRIAFISITEEGLLTGIKMGLRLFYLVLFANITMMTTSPIELSDGIESLLSPFKRYGLPAHEFAMMMTIALRFIPTLLDETDRIMKAQLARGADLDSGGIIKRFKALIPVLVPLFVIVFQRAEELAVAMEARCYRGDYGRSRMRPLMWGVCDSLYLSAILFISASGVILDRWIL
ncbi:CbiQ family ECF transporter T component [Acetomicrobium hydrogeniformans]|uniref:Energy-coupling factor transporter transmembrane protein EcfT n=1 Tax=Acetomicrobium hydrogeniformans TaxID=649746 RepID=A0A7V6ZF50_9BACT|nr:energy-coupling factor transporter transmembrane protein EcfT [Acetomicrobium hydrogeniformans]